jgi:hypothetical protein
MLFRIVILAAALLPLSCGESVEAICDDALQEFYRCGGAPQASDMDACIDRYETSSYACQRTFRDRLNCTYGIACSSEDSLCAAGLIRKRHGENRSTSQRGVVRKLRCLAPRKARVSRSAQSEC